jgi:hypothetical protein
LEQWNRYNFFGAGNKNDITVSIFHVVSNGNVVTVLLCANDAHLCLEGTKISDPPILVLVE